MRRRLTAKEAVRDILAERVVKSTTSDVSGVVAEIVTHLTELHCNATFRVCVSYRGGVADDQDQTEQLCGLLTAAGVRAVASAASIDAAAVLRYRPDVFVPIEPRSAIAPFAGVGGDGGVGSGWTQPQWSGAWRWVSRSGGTLTFSSLCCWVTSATTVFDSTFQRGAPNPRFHRPPWTLPSPDC